MSTLRASNIYDKDGGSNAVLYGVALQKRFLEVFDCVDGKLFWKINTNKSKSLIGRQAGCNKGHAYGTVCLDRKSYCVHRVIYCMHTGEWPEIVDHINNDTKDHRIENLRAATDTQNKFNKPAQANNKSGVKNVCWSTAHKKWAVQVQAHGKRVFSRLFADLELAELVAEEARRKYHGKFAWGV